MAATLNAGRQSSSQQATSRAGRRAVTRRATMSSSPRSRVCRPRRGPTPARRRRPGSTATPCQGGATGRNWDASRHPAAVRPSQTVRGPGASVLTGRRRASPVTVDTSRAVQIRSSGEGQMTTTSALSPTQHPAGYRHEALFWDGTEEFLAGTVPFVSAGLAAGMPVLIAVHDERWQALRGTLGADADRVQQVDTAELGHNPARIIPAWRELVAQAAGRPCRGIGEPIRDGMRAAHLAECQVHAAALNVAVPPSAPLWLLCSYDTGWLRRASSSTSASSDPVS